MATGKRHTENVYGKLDVQDRYQLFTIMAGSAQPGGV